MYKHLLTALLFVTLSTVWAQPPTKSSFTRGDTLRGMLSPLRTCYDVNYYHLDVKVDIAEKQISGSNLFRFTATQDFKKLQFDLFDNFLIEKIRYNGRDLDYTTEFDAVFVEFPSLIKKGTKAEFIVYYSGSPVEAENAPWDGGFIWSKDAAGKPWVAVACQGLGASSWWPNKDHQSDEPDSMLISVSVPDGLTDISNGRLRSTRKVADGYTQFDWFVSSPINNYNVTLNIGDYSKFSDSYPGLKGNLDLDFFVLNENLQKAKQHFSGDVKAMLKSFEHWFGPYPFYKDGYKLVETPYLGMEHQSAIAYGNHFLKGYRGRDLSGTSLGLDWDYIIVHESGHEWFGNNITAKDIADMWIHEAFTTYSEGLFVESRKGKAAAAEYIKGQRKNIHNDAPIIGIYDVNKEGSGDMYFKGSNMLHTIRSIINDDDKWLQILRGLNSTFGLKTTTTAEIVNYVNKTSGIDLTKIFDQYLRFRSIPTLEIRQAGTEMQYRWRSDVKGFNMPIKVKLADGSLKVIYPTAEWKSVKTNRLLPDTDNFYINVKNF